VYKIENLEVVKAVYSVEQRIVIVERF